jgi:hypothetical protein
VGLSVEAKAEAAIDREDVDEVEAPLGSIATVEVLRRLGSPVDAESAAAATEQGGDQEHGYQGQTRGSHFGVDLLSR